MENMVANGNITLPRPSENPGSGFETTVPPGEPAASLTKFGHPFERESYLNAALLFALGGFFDLSAYWLEPVGFLFVYVAVWIQAVGWFYLFLGARESKVDLAIFLASALAGAVSLGILMAPVLSGLDPAMMLLWLVLWAGPFGSLVALVFGPVVVLHGALFAHAMKRTVRGASHLGRGVVLLGVAILEVTAILAIAASADEPLPTFPWAALPAVGYVTVAVGLYLGRKASAAQTLAAVESFP